MDLMYNYIETLNSQHNEQNACYRSKLIYCMAQQVHAWGVHVTFVLHGHKKL